MEIMVAATLEEARENSLLGKTAVVIDVLRATTTIITALQNGAEKVIPVLEPQDALLYKEKTPCILGGERKSCIIPGFDCGNSPFEFTREFIHGRTLVISTTNGTRALHAVHQADKIYLAALVNSKAVAEYLIKENKDTLIVCAGTEGKFSSDDFLAAGAILYKAREFGDFATNDLGDVATIWYKTSGANSIETLMNCFHGKRLMKLGLEKDINCCAQEDTTKVVPEYFYQKDVIVCKGER